MDDALFPVDAPTAPAGHTTVYRLYDADDVLLYVGVAGNPGRRFEQHAGDKPWWGEVALARMQHCSSRRGALAAEKAAIIMEAPRHNVVHATPGAAAQGLRFAPEAAEGAAEFVEVDGVLHVDPGSLSMRRRWESYVGWMAGGWGRMRVGRNPSEAHTPDDEWEAVLAYGRAFGERRSAAFAEDPVPVTVRLHDGNPGPEGLDHIVDDSERSALWSPSSAWMGDLDYEVPAYWVGSESPGIRYYEGRICRRLPWSWDRAAGPGSSKPVTVWVDGEYMYEARWHGDAHVAGNPPWWAHPYGRDATRRTVAELAERAA